MKPENDESTNNWGSLLRSRTQAEAARHYQDLGYFLEKVESWHSKISVPFKVHPESTLGLANQMSEPFQASHSLSYLRLTAVDHLHAVRTLLVEAKSQHIFAPYSLLRASIENAAVGLWLVKDSSARSIAIRSLKLEWANHCDRKNAYEAIGAPSDEIDDREHRFKSLEDHYGMKKEGLRARPPGFRKMIDEASETYGFTTEPTLMWQMCSAATHGRTWISGLLTMMDAEDDGESKVISGKLTSDEQGILFALVAACDLIERLFQVARLRSVPERHTGAAFTREERKLLKPNLNLLVPSWMGRK